MPGLNVALEIGKRALVAHQMALQTVSHNISNASTEGYTRQVPQFETTPPEPAPALTQGYLGTGVILNGTQRKRSIWIDQQMWRDSQTGGYWEELQGTLHELETFYPESAENGISTLLSDFFHAWQELSRSPEEATMREAVVQDAIGLANTFNLTGQRMSDLRGFLDQEVGQVVGEINQITQEIADLNHEIRFAEWQVKGANDLRDKRDLLVDKLSKLINIQVAEQADSTITITVGADILVQNETAELMQAVVGGSGYLDVEWAATGNPVPVTNGKLGGLLYCRDTMVPSYITELDSLAAELINAVNTQHGLGFDLSGNPGGAFFVGADAATIGVSAAVQADPNLIAAAGAAAGAPGDNSNALAIAMLADQLVAGLGNTTFSGYYGSILGRLGTETQEADSTLENQELVLKMLEERRQAVSGVSMDEEVANLIRYQRAYQAAARVITSVDELLELVVNRMGLVGR